MNLTRKQLSLLITIFTMANVVLLAYNIHLGSKQAPEYVIEMSLTDEDIEEILKEEEERLEELAENSDPIATHRAFNETVKSSFGNPEPLKTLEELMEERELNNQKDFLSSDNGFQANLKELAEKREEKKKLLGEREADKKEFTNNLAEKRTTISFSLKDRNAYDIPPPIYTCIEGGKVVINIEVNQLGDVIEANFNEKSSTTTNGCLVDNALEYARRAVFNSSSRQKQIGTITYLFQRK
ncbi:hypothetical protein [Croceivirga thetidis]|uniref:Energy transducer TonB n=1 Tax=Croceivirga thetidis TaxID=2721623 RepID=A0ABX1GPQ0_9FLAO|nr:hypothetical protein [Croceivirga thetidis]NKI31564.1 hypothetical protein [Croceivirga thetidis]